MGLWYFVGERKAMPHFEVLREGKPSKRDRREIDRLRGPMIVLGPGEKSSATAGGE
jgi:hypothetical protein